MCTQVITAVTSGLFRVPYISIFTTCKQNTPCNFVPVQYTPVSKNKGARFQSPSQQCGPNNEISSEVSSKLISNMAVFALKFAHCLACVKKQHRQSPLNRFKIVCHAVHRQNNRITKIHKNAQNIGAFPLVRISWLPVI
jgi:hypothetical protein